MPRLLSIYRSISILTRRHPLEAHLWRTVGQQDAFEQTLQGSEARVQAEPADEKDISWWSTCCSSWRRYTYPSFPLGKRRLLGTLDVRKENDRWR